MDIDLARHDALSHEQRAEETRVFLAGELRGLIEDLKHVDKYDRTAGMLAVLVSAYKELGRLYQVSEKPGGKGLSEIQVTKMILEAEQRGRQEAQEALTSQRQLALEAATISVKDSLEALSQKSLG